MPNNSSIPPAGRLSTPALEKLYALGARFILLEGKVPIGRSGLFTRPRPTAAAAAKHLATAGNHVGIEPASLGYGVIDVDGSRKGEPPADPATLERTAAKLAQPWGDQIAAALPSMSGGGKCHIWRLIDLTDPAPLGLKQDGSPYLAAPTDLYLAESGRGSGTAFDVRFRHSYVRTTNYLNELAEFCGNDGSPPWSGWPRIIPHGRRYKTPPPPPEQPSLPLPAAPAASRLEGINRGYIAGLPPLTEGQRHHIVNTAGYRAGQEFRWNPTLIKMLEAWATANGLSGRRIRNLHLAFRDGQNNPVPPPEDRPISNSAFHQPPIEAYNDPPPERSRR